MKPSILLLGAIFTAFTACASSAAEKAAAPAGRIAFARAEAVWIANIDGSNARKIAAGFDPCISPDGGRIAFTQDTSDKKDVRRHIAVADAATRAVTVFRGMPSDNSYGPVWSPDGAKILFNILTDRNWHIGVVNADGTGFAYLKKADKQDHSFWSACWVRDGRSIFCQDMSNIYRAGLDGEIAASFSVQKTFARGDMNSGARMHVSPDGKRLLVDVDMDEEVTVKNWDGPPPAVWMLDLETKNAARLTPKKSFAWDSCWLGDTEFLFVSTTDGGKTRSIYRASTTGGPGKLLIKNAANPSVAAPPRQAE
jgi:TolB protein